MATTDTQDPPETADELAARRQTQAEREATADFDAAQNGKTPAAGDDGKSLEEMEGDGSLTEEDDGQVAFVVEHGRKVGLGQLYDRKTPVELEFKLGAKAIKGGEGTGLISFSDPDLVLVVPVRAGKVVVDPTYDADGNVKKVVIRPNMKPLRAYDSRTDAGRAALLGDGNLIAQIVAQGRAEGTADDAIRASLITEIDTALNKSAA